MTTTDEDPIIDTSITCPIEVAAAKLLGLMKGARYQRLTAIISGETQDLNLLLYNGDINLGNLLGYLRHQASKELTAAKADPSVGNLNEKEKALAEINTLIDRSINYLSDINEELEKGTDSTLKIDPQRTKDYRATHITLASLDRWARQKYGIAILGDLEHHVSSEDRQTRPAMQDMEEDLASETGLSKTAANNLYTSFAFLVEAFAETAPKYGKGKKPNISAIAKHIAELAAKASGEKTMDNQSYDSIRKRITQALETKKSNLPQR